MSVKQTYTNAKFRNKSRFNKPDNGKPEQYLTDPEITELKLRLREDGRPTWYLHYTHPITKKRKKEKLRDLMRTKDPAAIREIATKRLLEAKEARIFEDKLSEYEHRDVTVEGIVEEYIYRLENGIIKRNGIAKTASPKTIISYMKDLRHLASLYEGVRAVDLTDDLVDKKNTENIRRIRSEHDTQIEKCTRKIALNLVEVQDPQKYGLTPRNIRKRLNENIRLEDKIESLRSPKRTGHQQNRNATALLKAAYNALSEQSGYPQLRMISVKFPVHKSEPRSLTSEQADALEAKCVEMINNRENYPDTWRHACFIMLLMFSGARKTELMTAEIGTLKLDDGGYVIHCLNNKEGDNSKRVFFLKDAVPFMQALVGNKTNGILFDVTEYPDTAARNIVKAAGVDGWTGFHDLRHTFASKALSSGLSLAQIGGLLGQKTVSVTQTYGYLFDEDKKSAVSKINANESSRKLASLKGRMAELVDGVDVNLDADIDGEVNI